MKLKFLFHRINTPAYAKNLPKNLIITYVHKNRENPYLWAELYRAITLKGTIADLFIKYEYKEL